MRTAAVALLALGLTACTGGRGPMFVVWSSPGAVVAEYLIVQKHTGPGCKSGLDTASEGTGDTEAGGTADVATQTGGLSLGTAGTFVGSLATLDDCSGLLQLDGEDGEESTP